MRKVLAATLAAFLVSGCSYGGHYIRSGVCEGWRSDANACKRAHANREAIAGVSVGDSLAQVRGVMGDPERREADAAGERWWYLTDYDAHMMSVVKFADGRVVSITQQPQ